MKPEFRFNPLTDMLKLSKLQPQKKLKKCFDITFYPQRSSKDTTYLNTFQGMLSMCGSLLWLSEQASLTQGQLSTYPDP